MKRIKVISIVMVLSMIIVLISGCAPAQEEPAEQLVFGLSNAWIGSEWRSQMLANFELASQELGIETVAEQTAKTVNSIAEQSRPKAVKTPAPAASGAYYKHKVEPGETLSAIARAYKVSVKDIKQTSGIKGDMIRVGQILHVPKK